MAKGKTVGTKSCKHQVLCSLGVCNICYDQADTRKYIKKSIKLIVPWEILIKF